MAAVAGRSTGSLDSMWNEPVVRDVLLLAIASTAGAIVAIASAPKEQSRHPVWAVRLYLGIFKLFPGLRASANREWFSRREQFMAIFFVVSFIIFTATELGLGCSYQLGCK